MRGSFRFGRRSLAGARAADRVFVPVSGLKSVEASCAAGFTTRPGRSPKPDRKAGGVIARIKEEGGLRL